MMAALLARKRPEPMMPRRRGAHLLGSLVSALIVIPHCVHTNDMAPATLEFWVRFPNERNRVTDEVNPSSSTPSSSSSLLSSSSPGSCIAADAPSRPHFPQYSLVRFSPQSTQNAAVKRDDLVYWYLAYASLGRVCMMIILLLFLQKQSLA